ncbi:MAG: hydrolase [Sphaerisporangium sp.]|nr:hydrolase [Sphaerisporangium sp.]
MKTSPGLAARTVDRFFDRLRKLPAPRNKYVVERGLRTPTQDGFVLVSDHYAPVVSGAGSATILIRTPYGRGMPVAQLWGRTFAARGYHVILQSCRGTLDSTGTFEPMVREAEDAQDTIVWLREQPWFNGELATMGMSYLAFTQWALLADPPPELRASVMIAGPHDFSRAIWENGSFALENFLGWSDANSVPFENRPSLFRQLAGNKQTVNRQKAASAGLPMAHAAESILGGRAPWYREWLERPDLTDPYWRRYNFTDAGQRVQTPTLLVGGWQDIFVGQTIEQYEALRSRGIDVALTLGPWTHVGHLLKGSAVIDNEALNWLDMHLGNQGPGRRTQPVHTFITGSGAWHASPVWPPSRTETTWYPNDDGLLGTTVSPGGRSKFRFDPSDPTPSVGGRRLSAGAGVRNNGDLEARRDVLTFTTPALTAELEFEGFPVVDVSLSVDNSYADIFIRICDVDKKGRSHNITDTLVRLDTTAAADEVQHITARLSPCAHRLMKGHRLRLQLSGGAHPQYARNLGTGEPLSTGTGLKASVHTINHDNTRLTLPVTSSTITRPL